MSDYIEAITGKISDLAKKAKELGEQAVETVDRDGKVRGVYARGAGRAKAFGRIAKLSVSLNGENEELGRIYAEIGRLYCEQNRGGGEGFLGALVTQARECTERIRGIEAEIESLRASALESEAEKDIDVEIGEFDDIVSADEKAATEPGD